VSGSLFVQVPQAVAGWSHSKKVQHCLLTSDHHKTSMRLSSYVTPVPQPEKKLYFVDICSYIVDSHCEKTLSMLELPKLF